MANWRMAFRDGNRGPSLWPDCRRMGIAAITYSPVEDIDFSRYPNEEPKAAWSQLETSQRASLRRFLYEMEENDVIYVKEGPMIVGKGVVAGPYQFDEESRIRSGNGESWRQQRRVTWLGDFPEMLHTLGHQQVVTVVQLTDDDVQSIESRESGTKVEDKVLTSGFWIFNCDPEKYRLADRFADPNPDITWRVTKFRNKIRPGDTIFIWETGRDRGVRAVLRAEGVPQDMHELKSEQPYSTERDTEVLCRVRATITHRNVNLPDSHLRSVPGLENLSVFRRIQRGTNFYVPPAEGAILLDLVRRGGLGVRAIPALENDPFIQATKGWLFQLSNSEESNWGSVDEFYANLWDEGSDPIEIESKVWGKLNSKDLLPRAGDGIAFYHTSRARFPSDDRFGKRPRISLIGTLLDVKTTGELRRIRVQISRGTFAAMRENPILLSDETRPLFEACGKVKGSIATCYEIPPAVWTKFLSFVLAPPEEKKGASGIGTSVERPPERMEYTISRVVRDSRKTKELKDLYGFTCQICGDRLEIGPDEYYAEVHHIRPLGGVHAGHDSTDNMLVVCPNHHAMFDMGVPVFDRQNRVAVNGKTYPLTLKHEVARENLDYHNSEIANGPKTRIASRLERL